MDFKTPEERVDHFIRTLDACSADNLRSLLLSLMIAQSVMGNHEVVDTWLRLLEQWLLEDAYELKG